MISWKYRFHPNTSHAAWFICDGSRGASLFLRIIIAPIAIVFFLRSAAIFVVLLIFILIFSSILVCHGVALGRTLRGILCEVFRRSCAPFCFLEPAPPASAALRFFSDCWSLKAGKFV
jgi:hypothetical protein